MKLVHALQWALATTRAQISGLYVSIMRPSLFRRAWVVMVLGFMSLALGVMAYILFVGPSVDDAASKDFSLAVNAIVRFSDQRSDPNAILEVAEEVRKLSAEYSQSMSGVGQQLEDHQFAIFSATGELIGASPQAPLTEMQQRVALRMRLARTESKSSAKISPSSNWIISDAMDSRGRFAVYGLSVKSFRTLSLYFMLRELPNIFLHLLVVSLLVWGLTRFSLRPIGRLAEDIKKMDSTRFETLTPRVQYVELRDVVMAINDRTQAAQQSVVREREFFSNAAHELRTPLAVVSAQAHSLAQSDDPAVRKAESERLQAGVARAATLVSRLLNLARLDGHAASTNYVDLGAVATECCSTHALRAIRAEQELALEQDETNNAGTGKCEAVAAAEDVQLIIENLVDNAIRYAGAGAVIVVRTGYVEQYQVDGNGTNNRWAMVSVSNTGAGFTELDKARAFTRFQRGSRADQSSGSGLGLAIVKAAAERHGGHVRLIAPADGVGACVEVRLPPKPKNA
jgi:signal transduction histidine kinase